MYIETYNDKPKIEIVSKMLPITATRTWQKGEEMIVNGIKKGRPYKGSNWAYEMPEAMLTDINTGLIPLIDKIIPYKKEFQEIRSLGFDIYIELVLSIVSFNRPAMSLNKYVIDSLSELECEIGFDLYFDDGDEE